MWPLAGAAALTWYAIGYRLASLRSRVIARARRAAERAATEIDLETRGAVPDAGLPAAAVIQARVALALGPFEDDLGRFRVPLAALVVAAPLLGLLGTVSGMMETFGSLGEGVLYTQGGGIAAGVSEALLTTQMGLAVAIPGLLVGRVLARREARLRERLAAVRHDVVARHLAGLAALGGARRAVVA
jgi:biopolymer transport protein ExbB